MGIDGPAAAQTAGQQREADKGKKAGAGGHWAVTIYAKTIAGDFPVGTVCLRRFLAGVSIFEGGILQHGKRCLLPDQGYGIKIPCSA
jgi:hypothetical protein